MGTSRKARTLLSRMTHLSLSSSPQSGQPALRLASSKAPNGLRRGALMGTRAKLVMPAASCSRLNSIGSAPLCGVGSEQRAEKSAAVFEAKLVRWQPLGRSLLVGAIVGSQGAALSAGTACMLARLHACMHAGSTTCLGVASALNPAGNKLLGGVHAMPSRPLTPAA